MDLSIPQPRARASFRDFVDVMRREHALCPSISGKIALKSWRLHQPDGRWKVTLVCDECGGHSIILTEADLATLNAHDPTWLESPAVPCDYEVPEQGDES